jgi:GntR family transcriptional repressor for pyruvate dehydrogenase complex
MIREALKMLPGKGLVDLARGRRAVVREPDASAFGELLTGIIQHDPKGVFDLVEVRMRLEIRSVTLAAKRVSRSGLAAIENMLGGMRAAPRDIAAANSPEAERRFHQCDVGVHEAVAMASGDRVLTYLFEAMAQPLETSFCMSRRGGDLRAQSLDSTVAAHERILDALRSGDARSAAEAMRAHLEDAGRDMRAAFSAPDARTRV